MGSGTTGEFELHILLAIMQAGGATSGVEIRREIEHRTARSISVGAVYTALERLEDKGLIESFRGNPLGKRGRPRNSYRILDDGIKAAASSWAATSQMAAGLKNRLDAAGAISDG